MKPQALSKPVLHYELRFVHTTDDNYKDNDKNIVLKIVLILTNSRVHTTDITLKVQRNDIIGIAFRMIFFPADEW